MNVPSNALLALELTAESDKLSSCPSVVDGRRPCVVVGCSFKPHNGRAGIDRFLKSFKLGAKR